MNQHFQRLGSKIHYWSQEWFWAEAMEKKRHMLNTWKRVNLASGFENFSQSYENLQHFVLLVALTQDEIEVILVNESDEMGVYQILMNQSPTQS